jgi:hypothetical protein
LEEFTLLQGAERDRTSRNLNEFTVLQRAEFDGTLFPEDKNKILYEYIGDSHDISEWYCWLLANLTHPITNMENVVNSENWLVWLISLLGSIFQCGKIKQVVSLYSSTVPTRSCTMQPFDTDSLEIKIDNFCSTTLSGHKADFMPGTMKPIKNVMVQGYSTTGDMECATHEGTIRWRVMDDNGKSVTLSSKSHCMCQQILKGYCLHNILHNN